MDTTRSTEANIIGPYEIRHIPTGIAGQWYVVNRRTNIHIMVCHLQEEAIMWAQRVADAADAEQRAE